MRTAEEIVEAQGRVGQSLERARVNEDRLITGQIRDRGEQFVRLFVGLTRLRRIYAENNAAFAAPSKEIASTLDALLDLLGIVELVAVEGQVYVNDIRVRFAADLDAGAELGQLLARHEAAGLVFRAQLDPTQALNTAVLVAGAPAPQKPRPALISAIRRAGVPGVRVSAPQRVRYAGETQGSTDHELGEAYTRSLRILSRSWQNAADYASIPPLRFRRMVADLTGLELSAHLRQLSLGAQDMTAPEYSRHSLTVASLAVALGRAAGLPPDALSDLGLAGFFHDVGYLRDGSSRAATHEAHGSEGCLRILGEPGLTTAKLHRASAALFHHLDFRATPQPPLFARIVRIADDYDTLTRVRGASGRRCTPPDALAWMSGRAGRAYDPVLVKLFVNLLGRYPPGTILELPDRRWVVSVSGARSPETFDRPLCVPLGQEGEEGSETVDLAEHSFTVRVRG